MAKVWQITYFDEIYKIKEEIRKGKQGPLNYTKSFVSLSGISRPCEVHLHEMLRYLKARTDRHLLRSVYEDLKNWSAEKMQEFQGYLVTHAGKPADMDYIAAQLQIEKAEFKKAMMALCRIGLIRKVTYNGQFSTKNEDCPETSGNLPESSGNEPEIPLNDKGKGKASAAPQQDNKQKATNGLSADDCKKKKNGKTEDSSLPSKPCESDLEGESADTSTSSPPGAVKPPAASQRAGPVHRKGDYEKSDLVYGERIFFALGFKKTAKNNDGIRDITSFASKWHQCRCRMWGLSPPEQDKIGIRGLRQAEKIAKQKNCVKQKVWNKFMDDISIAKAKMNLE